ncbi:MAG: ATP synthase F1 subunit delta [Butyrivibrio sp.]
MAKLVSAAYGDALFDVAIEQNAVDSMYEEATAVRNALSDNPDLMNFLNHPKIDKDEKIATVENIFKKFLSEEMTGFLITVVRKDRCSELADILEYFTDRIREHKRIGRAYVTTPMELSEDSREKVKKRLLETTDYKEFDMIYAVDESLIGGMVIRIGDKIVDSSIKTRLSELSRQLNKIDV